MNRLETIKTITVLTLALLIAYLFFKVSWLLWLAVLLTLGNTFESRITAAVARYWMRFAEFLGNINSKLILMFMFYGVLTPISFLYRRFNEDKVDHFRKNRQQSYFEDVEKSYSPEDFEKLW